MVKPESYDLQSKRGILILRNINLNEKTLERATNGSWFLVVDVDMTFRLGDGRVVTVSKKLRLRGSQEGKLPNPNPFGRNTKRKKAGKA